MIGPRAIASSLLLATALTNGCGGRSPEPITATSRSEPTPARLVVLLVYDQWGSWVHALHHDALAPDGAVRWLEERGLVVERARYAYAGTYTAPGHAAIVTGASPSESGISSNRVWDRSRRRRVSSFDDGIHPLLARPDGFASLAQLRVPTVADQLAAATAGRARIVAVAMKDRSALPPGGRSPTLSLWFDSATGRFTTSSALAATLPAWVEDFTAGHPVDAYRGPWEPLRAYDELGPDAQPGEGGYGLDASFPHDATGLEDPDALLAMPGSTELLLALAERAVVEEHLGEDDVADFLSISIGSTDYVGHAFGPESWEYRDHLIRVDRAVGQLLVRLAERTALAVVLTSDHGVAPLPERAGLHALPPDARRWSTDEELPLLREYLDASLGAREGGWVDAWVVPYVYLASAVRDDATLRARAIAAIEAHLRARPGIGRVVDVRDAATLRASPDEIERAVGLSIPDEPPGDVLVLPSEGSVVDDGAGTTGTAHGSAYPYDRDVPVLVVGPGVRPGRMTAPVAQSRVAATLARLLGVPSPRADARPLLGPE